MSLSSKKSAFVGCLQAFIVQATFVRNSLRRVGTSAGQEVTISRRQRFSTTSPAPIKFHRTTFSDVSTETRTAATGKVTSFFQHFFRMKCMKITSLFRWEPHYSRRCRPRWYGRGRRFWLHVSFFARQYNSSRYIALRYNLDNRLMCIQCVSRSSLTTYTFCLIALTRFEQFSFKGADIHLH